MCVGIHTVCVHVYINIYTYVYICMVNGHLHCTFQHLHKFICMCVMYIQVYVYMHIIYVQKYICTYIYKAKKQRTSKIDSSLLTPCSILSPVSLTFLLWSLLFLKKVKGYHTSCRSSPLRTDVTTDVTVGCCCFYCCFSFSVLLLLSCCCYCHTETFRGCLSHTQTFI